MLLGLIDQEALPESKQGHLGKEQWGCHQLNPEGSQASGKVCDCGWQRLGFWKPHCFLPFQ